MGHCVCCVLFLKSQFRLILNLCSPANKYEQLSRTPDNHLVTNCSRLNKINYVSFIVHLCPMQTNIFLRKMTDNWMLKLTRRNVLSNDGQLALLMCFIDKIFALYLPFNRKYFQRPKKSCDCANLLLQIRKLFNVFYPDKNTLIDHRKSQFSPKIFLKKTINW